MRKNVAVVVMCAIVGLAVAIAVPRILAKDNTESKQNWSRLEMATYTSGLTGFFDPDTGMYYVYDSNLENCFMIRQITTLGEPMKKIKN